MFAWLTTAGDEKGTDWAGQVSEKDVDDHPTNRAGRPKDIADAALYLIDAGFITGMPPCFRLAYIKLIGDQGQDITVDGGALRKKH
jgi:NAD(P)-dependent dehydrogenase (short-subunit alcohol dehydrogenase family)